MQSAYRVATESATTNEFRPAIDVAPTSSLSLEASAPANDEVRMHPQMPPYATEQRNTATEARPEALGETEQKGMLRNVAPGRWTERPVTSERVAEWQGHVLDVLDDHLIAELHGTHGEGVTGSIEEASIPLTDVRDSDLPLVKPGSFFRLCISYEVGTSGMRRRYTEVVFRRLPAYRADALNQARESAERLARGLRLE